jgi:hypothetical protein
MPYQLINVGAITAPKLDAEFSPAYALSKAPVVFEIYRNPLRPVMLSCCAAYEHIPYRFGKGESFSCSDADS